MTSNRYVIRNCPAIISLYERPQCALPSNYYCKDCTDCVIKQVIEKCKEHPFKDCACGDEILQLFDIEEINK